MLLYPAATIRIAPYIGPDSSVEHRAVASFIRVRPKLIIEEFENPDWVSVFQSMYGWDSDRGTVSTNTLVMNRAQTFYVPAEIQFKRSMGHT